MEFTSRKNIEKISLPLPIYDTIHIADTVSKDGEKFSVVVGLDKTLIAQLKRYSMDESDVNLQKYTKDKERFVVGSYENWYKKIRTPFALIHKKSGSMAAIVRFGPESLFEDVSNWHTAGWRSYGSFRGKGFMKDFTQFSLNFYLNHYPNIKIWITSKKENTGSINLATALGFKIDQKKSDRETTETNKETFIMIK